MKTNDTASIMRRHRERNAASVPVVQVDKGAGRDVTTTQRVKPKVSVWSKLRVLLLIKKLVSDPTMLNKLKSRKLWVSVLGAAGGALAAHLGVDPSLIQNVLTLLGVYVAGEALADAAGAYKAIKSTPLLPVQEYTTTLKGGE